MSEESFETVALYRSTLEGVLRDVIEKAVWWGQDNKAGDALKYADELAKQRVDWIVKELTFDALTRKMKEESK